MKRRKFTKEYKEQAVLQTRSGTRNVRDVARELGISETLLWRWRSEYERAKGIQLSDGTVIDAATLEEVKRLRARVADLEEERDILKKAAAYFARHQQ